jgi:ferredoxin
VFYPSKKPVKTMSVEVHFLPDDIRVSAEPGEGFLIVAERANVLIPTGCLMGSCHACEIEIVGGETLCACISSIPKQAESLTVLLYSDPTWS